jgi:hypothetical protein
MMSKVVENLIAPMANVLMLAQAVSTTTKLAEDLIHAIKLSTVSILNQYNKLTVASQQSANPSSPASGEDFLHHDLDYNIKLARNNQ